MLYIRMVTNQLPSGNLTQLLKITIFYGKINYKWQFSIVMLVYQRVYTNWAYKYG